MNPLTFDYGTSRKVSAWGVLCSLVAIVGLIVFGTLAENGHASPEPDDQDNELLHPLLSAVSPTVNYTYNASVVRVVDGDTVDVLIDLGFHVFTKQRLRMRDVFAAERGEPNYHRHTDNLKRLLPENSKCVLSTSKDTTDKYGRYVAVVWVVDNNINETQQAFIGAPAGRQ